MLSGFKSINKANSNLRDDVRVLNINLIFKRHFAHSKVVRPYAALGVLTEFLLGTEKRRLLINNTIDQTDFGGILGVGVNIKNIDLGFRYEINSIITFIKSDNIYPRSISFIANYRFKTNKD